ncbi:YiiX/YebB-like N1pC/P60 family cysteine hydrolase, partial [Enterococcus faecium]
MKRHISSMENQRLSHIFGLSKQLIISPILETKAGGVVYGALDDERFDYTHSTILRVSAATTAQKKAAISFMHGQLGKQYDAGFGLFTKNRLSSRKDWYCSILVWAAYMNAT